MDRTKFIKLGVGLLILFLLGVFLKLAKPVLIPFSMALLLAFAVSPLLDILVRRNIPKPMALAIVLLLAFVVLYLMGTVFYTSGKSFAAEIPSYHDLVQSFLTGIEESVQNERLRLGLQEWVRALNVGRVGSVVLSALGPFLSFMSQLMLVFVFMTFILAGRGRMEKKIAQAFPPEQASTLTRTVGRINCEIQKYLAVKTLINLGIGALVAAVLALFGIPFAVLFGLLALLLNYVPTLGAVIAVALPVLMAAFLAGAFRPAVWIIAGLLAGIHVLLNGVLEPRLMGRELNLPPLLVLFSLFFWAWLWGVPGMILAVPILAILKIVFANVPSLNFLEAMLDK
ncbi:MAG: AI-2E family transporter [Candidatus Aminicenantes bacterium]